MLGKKNQSSLLAKYFSMYKQNPRSKVFAPLAESFRRLGMLEDSFRILKEGIRNHPHYTLGYIVLAHCYFDQGKFELTYNTLRPIIGQNADNISLQKIFAQACLNLGYLEEALDTYKYLLFMNPKDRFFAEQVKKLEDDLHVGHKKLSLDQIIKAPDMPLLPQGREMNDDDWVQVNFSGDSNEATETPEASDDWVMNIPNLGKHSILQKETIEKRSLEDDFYADEFEEYGDIEESSNSRPIETPIVSHTLIDLYCAQRYYDKALELLQKILDLNPNDQESIAKMKQVMELQKGSSGSKAPVTEQDGHEELIQIIETQVKAKSPKEMQLEKLFGNFLAAVKDKSQNYR